MPDKTRHANLNQRVEDQQGIPLVPSSSASYVVFVCPPWGIRTLQEQENASGGIATGKGMEGSPGVEQPSDAWYSG